jgi:DNA-binding GntR family transcriptional regulator
MQERVSRIDGHRETPPAPTGLQRDLARQVRDIIRADGLAPGAPILLQPLAKRLGVSRTPLRAALALLDEHGVVTAAPGGTAVRDPEASLDGADATDLVDALVVAIARDRIAGHLPEAVMTADLKRRYGAAHGTLSRALAHLVEIGLVEPRKGFGWRFVAGFASEEDRAASYRFRLVVEPAALAEPGYALDPAWIADMTARHEEVLRKPWRDALAVGFFEMNAAFHTGLVAGSGNRHFVQATEQQARLRRLINYNWGLGEERVRVSAREHLSILEAVSAGDPKAASERLMAHLQGTSALRRGAAARTSISRS